MKNFSECDAIDRIINEKCWKEFTENDGKTRVARLISKEASMFRSKVSSDLQALGIRG